MTAEFRQTEPFKLNIAFQRFFLIKIDCLLFSIYSETDAREFDMNYDTPTLQSIELF